MNLWFNPAYCYNCGVVLPEDASVTEFTWVPQPVEGTLSKPGSIYSKYLADINLRATFGPNVDKIRGCALSLFGGSSCRSEGIGMEKTVHSMENCFGKNGRMPWVSL